MKVFGRMKLSGFALIAAASSFSYSSFAQGIDSKLTLRPTRAPMPARTSAGMAILAMLRPAVRIAVISLSEESLPSVMRTPVSMLAGSANVRA